MSFHVRPIREQKDGRPSALKKLIARILGLLRSVKIMRSTVSAHKNEERQDKKRLSVLKSIVTILVALLCAFILLAGTFKILLSLKVFSFSDIVSIAATDPPVDENGFTNVLLLGEGNSDHEGVDLTDTIMIGSIDPSETKSAVLLSVPRDLYVLSSAKMGEGRINSLYRNYKAVLMYRGREESDASKEALKELEAEVSGIFGITIHGSVKINFSGFEQAVDAIGGIDVDVPEDIVDTQYPGPNYSYVTFSIARGTQHLDGATALKYARSRHSTSDFSRSARQQQIIRAAVEKATQSGIITSASRISDLLTILSGNVESTFSTRELIGLAVLGKQVDGSRMVSMQLNDQAGLYGTVPQAGGFLYAPPRDEFEGASVLLPVSLPEFPVTWKQITAVSRMMFLHRQLYFRPPVSIAVFNNGAREGLARRLAAEMIRYNLNIVAVRNYDRDLPAPPQTESFVAVAVPPAADTPDAAARKQRLDTTADFLAQTLRVKRMDFQTPQPFADGPEVVIVLGKDYSYTPLQDMLQ